MGKSNDFAAQLSARLGEIASPSAVTPSNRNYSKNNSGILSDLFYSCELSTLCNSTS